jgi:cytidylate kinase
MERLVIAIDGPSGVGKSSLGKALARRLGILYIDSGAVYRAVAQQALDEKVPLGNAAAVADLALQSVIRLEGDPDHLRVFLNGREITREIRTPETSQASSIIATIPEVREAVVLKLREMSRGGGVVMDGRDIGTRVFPDAQLKLFLDAAPYVRARRRWEEDRTRGRDVTLDEISQELQARDRRDSQRLATPLVQAEDAILIDTSEMNLDRVIERVLEIVESRR